MINLVVNARDAIYEKKDITEEKKITIETSYVFLDKSYVTTHPDSQIGPHVVISVSDTGIGMDEETKRRIFDPFFTTKRMGKGTGLGLAAVYGIVKQNNGSIYVYSEPGQGTTFKIYWPVAKEQQVEMEEQEKNEGIVGGNEVILVVEDDRLVREFTCSSLKSLDYKVFATSNGKKALELVRKEGVKPDLLITDLIMSEMSGQELAEKMKEIFPSLPVLFISGYTNNYVVSNGKIKEGTDFLPKPYSVSALSQKIREILEKKKLHLKEK